MLRAEEANLRHALDLARAAGLWDAAVGCLQGLRVLYAADRAGRGMGPARRRRHPRLHRPCHRRAAARPRRPVEHHHRATGCGSRRQARDWPAATTLQNALIAWNRDQAAAALAAPAASLTPAQRNQIRNLAVALDELGNILREQDDPGCLPHFQEALALYQRIGDRTAEAALAVSLGNAYLMVPGLRDLDQAEHWYQHSLSLRADSDRLGRASEPRLSSARSPWSGSTTPAPRARPSRCCWSTSTPPSRSYQQALDLTPADDHETPGHHREPARHHLRPGRGHRPGAAPLPAIHPAREARGDIYGAGQTRYNIALLLDERPGRRRPALRPRRPGQLPAGRARRGRRRRPRAAADRRPGTAQPLTGRTGRASQKWDKGRCEPRRSSAAVMNDSRKVRPRRSLGNSSAVGGPADDPHCAVAVQPPPSRSASKMTKGRRQLRGKSEPSQPAERPDLRPLTQGHRGVASPRRTGIRGPAATVRDGIWGVRRLRLRPLK